MSESFREVRVSSLKASTTVLVVGALGFSSMYVLFTVIPVKASEISGSLGAGLATTIFMVFTIAAQFATPSLLKRVRAHHLLAAALLLLGIPSFVYLWHTSMPWLLLGASARGVGFGLITIVCTALVSMYAQGGRQGAALGAYGLATSLTGIVAPALGLILLQAWTPAPAIVAAIVPLAGLLLLGPVRGASPSPISASGRDSGENAGHTQLRHLLPGLAIFLPAAVAYGSIYTFLPLASDVAAGSLLCFGLGFAVGRLLGGRFVDRWSATHVLAPFVLVGLVGMLGLAISPHSVVEFVFATLLGAGIGGAASGTLAGLMRASRPESFGFVSTAWNLTFDIGIALGGLGLGLVVGSAGYDGAFRLLVVLFAGALALVVLSIGRRKGLVL